MSFISWLQLPFCSNFGAPQNTLTLSIVSPPICYEVMGPDAMILYLKEYIYVCIYTCTYIRHKTQYHFPLHFSHLSFSKLFLTVFNNKVHVFFFKYTCISKSFLFVFFVSITELRIILKKCFQKNPCKL